MKNYLIIGASSGIGKALALQLAQANHTVTATYNTHLPEAETAGVQWHQLDILQDNPDLSFIQTPIDGLVYCPGSINLKPFNRLNPADFLNDWQINFLGAVKVIQAVLPLLKQAGNASIVLFSTVAVGTGMPFHASISAAKAAVEALAKSLAAELAPAIRVNCIAPSLTNTALAEKLLSTPEKTDASAKRHPLQRIGQPAEMAALAAFLLSADAAFITGQVIHADGGLSAVKI